MTAGPTQSAARIQSAVICSLTRSLLGARHLISFISVPGSMPNVRQVQSVFAASLIKTRRNPNSSDTIKTTARPGNSSSFIHSFNQNLLHSFHIRGCKDTDLSKADNTSVRAGLTVGEGGGEAGKRHSETGRFQTVMLFSIKWLHSVSKAGKPHGSQWMSLVFQELRKAHLRGGGWGAQVESSVPQALPRHQLSDFGQIA